MCNCSSQVRDLNGAVLYDEMTYCKFCRGTLEATDPRIIDATLVPVSEFDDSVAGRLGRTPVTTLAFIPNYDIVEIMGLVHGVGNVAISVETAAVMFTTAGKAERAMKKAEDDLRREAKFLQADAVVAVKIAATSAGMSNLNRAQTLQLVGTAVRLKPQVTSLFPQT